MRCILRRGDRHLLVVHRRARGVGPQRWGLPGGRVEPREGLEEAFVWHTAEEVAVFAARGMLHAGFEEAAIRDFAVLTAADQLRPLRASRRLDCTS